MASRFVAHLLRSLASAFAAAVLCLTPLVASAQSSAQEFYSEGNANYNNKKYEDAVKLYIKAIQLQPKTMIKAYLNCARAYSMLNDFVNSKRFYDYYFEVSGNTADKKITAEYKAVVKKLKPSDTYVRPEEQARALVQLESTMMSGPYINNTNGGALSFYAILIRTGFSEPMIADLQKQLANGILQEVLQEIQPVEGQPLPNLDRLGWEFERSKLSKAAQFPDVQPDAALLARIEKTAMGWEAYLKSEYTLAAQYFDAACDDEHPIPAAYWGRMMTAFHVDADAAIFKRIDQTEHVYKEAGYVHYDAYFALLRAQVYKSQGKFDQALEELDKMGAAL